MKHLGDITKINGALVDPTSVIIGGSPCQDLSVAGKRAGLAGERSGLFMEQLRIIKEMRCADAQRGRTGPDIRPRWMVWENVPGAFSSNKGEDFGAVLHETIKVICPQAPAVSVPKNGWPTAGCLTDVDGKWSLAWRVFDAQFWGVPQRRKRIALIADFGGLTAPEILFERQGMPGDCPPGGAPWQRITTCSQTGVGETGNRLCVPINDKATRYKGGGATRKSDGAGNGLGVGSDGDPAPTLTAGDRHAVALENHPADSRVKIDDSGTIQTLTSRMGTGGGNTPLIMAGESLSHIECWEPKMGNFTTDGTCPTLMASAYKDPPCITGPQLFTMQGFGHYTDVCDVSSALKSRDCKDATDLAVSVHQNQNGDPRPGAVRVCYSLDAVSSNSMKSANPHSGFHETQIARCLDTTSRDPSCNQGGNVICQSVQPNTALDRIWYIVRRLTPLECERLQGYPDGWTDIGAWTDSKGKIHKDCSDSVRYKALGNSIALPSWAYILTRMSLCGATTLASLFDGIGGFPLLWERLHGKGSCLWASEIEEFPIAVTKYHFSEEGNTNVETQE